MVQRDKTTLSSDAHGIVFDDSFEMSIDPNRKPPADLVADVEKRAAEKIKELRAAKLN